jgi:methionyl-tRNA formyltransferase
VAAVVLFANGSLGRDAVRIVREAGDEIVALVVHPVERAREREAIVQAAGVRDSRVMDGDRLNTPDAQHVIAAADAVIGLSAGFGYILRRPVFARPARGTVNLHTSWLPFNRGAHPNAWALIEGTPAGATLHQVDDGVDTGPILARTQVRVRPTDTARSLYTRQERAALALLRRVWPRVREGRIPPRPQPPGGTAHRISDLANTDRVDWEETFVLRDLVNRLRGREFPPYPGCYTEIDGRRYAIRLRLRRMPERG